MAADGGSGGGLDHAQMEFVDRRDAGRRLAAQLLPLADDDPPREKIDDSYRAYPGDGVAPLAELLQTLHRTGGQKVLSLELFNRKYWSEDALEVAKTGLARMKAVAGKA